MQTFLPNRSYLACAHYLDNKRLNKQIVEAYQILVALHDPSYGWRNHPAVRMWVGYEYGLAYYGFAMCLEQTTRRGKKLKLYSLFSNLESISPLRFNLKPEWLTEEFILAHRSNLLRKDPEHYGKYWDVPNNLPYIWPVKDKLPEGYDGREAIRIALNDYRKKDTQLSLK